MAPECDHCGADVPDTAKKCSSCGEHTPWSKEIPLPATYTRLSQMVDLDILERTEYFSVDPYGCDSCGRGFDREITTAHAYFGKETGKVRALTCFMCGQPNPALNAQLAKLEQ